jgi:hypothetical protein
MELEDALYEYLKARPALASLLGTGDAARIYHMLIPQHVRGEATKLGCVVIQRAATGFAGDFCGQDPLVDASIQVDSYATTRDEANRIGRAVRDELVDYIGTLAGAVPIDRIACESDFPLMDPEPGLYRRSMTFRIWNEET